jgi:hypothetical protein
MLFLTNTEMSTFRMLEKFFFSSIVNNILISLFTSVPRSIGTLCLMIAFKIKK